MFDSRWTPGRINENDLIRYMDKCVDNFIESLNKGNER